jgi:antitoxin component of RelBE/YafQ-DinJ toxin-antitoxin module
MSHELSVSNTARFDLTAFESILPPRRPILGEEDGGFEAFREGLMASLVPMTAYEVAMADNLVAIEWDIVQLRRAQDRRVARRMTQTITEVYVEWRRRCHRAKREEAYAEFRRDGGHHDDWYDPFEFDEDAARENGAELACRACSDDPETKWAALDKIAKMGLDLSDAMSVIYEEQVANKTDGPLAILELRRRQVMRDYETLQSRRPIDVSRLDA